MMSAYSAASHGHGHPRILATLEAQARQLAVPSRAFFNDRLGPFLEELCTSQLMGRHEQSEIANNRDCKKLEVPPGSTLSARS
jgi:acetylornithine/succinyldiaminopimelate/putrescine aminotransferase